MILHRIPPPMFILNQIEPQFTTDDLDPLEVHDVVLSHVINEYELKLFQLQIACGLVNHGQFYVMDQKGGIAHFKPNGRLDFQNGDGLYGLDINDEIAMSLFDCHHTPNIEADTGEDWFNKQKDQWSKYCEYHGTGPKSESDSKFTTDEIHRIWSGLCGDVEIDINEAHHSLVSIYNKLIQHSETKSDIFVKLDD